jgi:hypothetical protein
MEFDLWGISLFERRVLRGCRKISSVCDCGSVPPGLKLKKRPASLLPDFCWPTAEQKKAGLVLRAGYTQTNPQSRILQAIFGKNFLITAGGSMSSNGAHRRPPGPTAVKRAAFVLTKFGSGDIDG